MECFVRAFKRDDLKAVLAVLVDESRTDRYLVFDREASTFRFLQRATSTSIQLPFVPGTVDDEALVDATAVFLDAAMEFALFPHDMQ
jgi:hypothetical protein